MNTSKNYIQFDEMLFKKNKKSKKTTKKPPKQLYPIKFILNFEQMNVFK